MYKISSCCGAEPLLEPDTNNHSMCSECGSWSIFEDDVETRAENNLRESGVIVDYEEWVDINYSY